MTEQTKAYFNTSVHERDPLVAGALDNERRRQQDQIELIASENIVSRAVLDALGHEMTNKTLEGYPGNRFHGGGQFVDVVEQAAIDRAKELFGCAYANVQPHSGTQANLAVFFLLLKPGDKVLSLDLAAGGHLSHGMKGNLSGRWFESHNYNVNPQTEVIDYDELERIAEEVRPTLLITGGSAYPRELDFERMGKIAKKVGAWFLVDMAHIAGLVAGGQHPSPFPHADIVTCTTTKTLRGPRGGLILCNDPELARRIDKAVFPGTQGGPLMHVIAGKAAAFHEALQPDFVEYSKAVIENARVLGQTLADGGLRLVSGGTDCHLVLVDLRPFGLTGKAAVEALEDHGLIANKNSVPYDTASPMVTSGLRLGSPSSTSRGFDAEAFRTVGGMILTILKGLRDGDLDSAAVKAQGRELTRAYPIAGPALTPA